jgi:hypothetical protein
MTGDGGLAFLVRRDVIARRARDGRALWQNEVEVAVFDDVRGFLCERAAHLVADVVDARADRVAVDPLRGKLGLDVRQERSGPRDERIERASSTGAP